MPARGQDVWWRPVVQTVEPMAVPQEKVPTAIIAGGDLPPRVAAESHALERFLDHLGHERLRHVGRGAELAARLHGMRIAVRGAAGTRTPDQ
jgi:hypothetical protein